MATCGPHELHSTCSTIIMPLQINIRATCGTQVALSLSLIHALQSHGIQVASHLNYVTTCSRLWPLVATRGPLVKCLLGHYSQVAVLARSPREIYLTVRIDCHSIPSRLRISVQPSKCFIGENTQRLLRKLSRR